MRLCLPTRTLAPQTFALHPSCSCPGSFSDLISPVKVITSNGGLSNQGLHASFSLEPLSSFAGTCRECPSRRPVCASGSSPTLHATAFFLNLLLQTAASPDAPTSPHPLGLEASQPSYLLGSLSSHTPHSAGPGHATSQYSYLCLCLKTRSHGAFICCLFVLLISYCVHDGVSKT